MRKYLIILLGTVFAVTLQGATPFILIDNFSDASLSEYTKTVILDQNAGHTAVFQSPAGTLQLTGGANGVEQLLLLRDDYSLGVNQMLTADLTWGQVARNDIGIAVAAVKNPAGLADGATGDVREDYIAVYVQADNTNLKGIFVNGKTAGSTIYAGGLPADPKNHVTGLYIRRNSLTEFTLGFIVDRTTYTDFATASIANTNIGKAVGFFGDFRNVAVFGDLDNLRIESETFGPHDPSVEQMANPVSGKVNAALGWKAGADPAGIYAVNPAIAEEYLFMSKNASDPNLYYVGSAGAPSIENPSSSFTVENLLYDSTYRWAVAEALTGYTQTFTKGISTLGDVDPNNIIGPVWTFDTLLSIPVIQQDLTDVRVFENESAAAFTVVFTSVNPVTVSWYKNGSLLTAGGDISITNTSTSSTLQISTPTLSDEGTYSCLLSVDPALTTDDVRTASALLVIKRMLAKYDFEQNLSDSSGSNAPSGQVKSVAGLPEPNETAAVSTAPVYVDGIDGKAIYLDGSQFVDFGSGGYPKAGPLNTAGDARGQSYERSGLGHGMEEGTVLCWVKPLTAGAIYTNANSDPDDTLFGLTTASANNARMIVRGENWDGSYQEIGTASGSLNKGNFSLQDGSWHLLAATWQDSTVRVYINGEQVGSATAGFPEKYNPWERSNILGASRSSGTARHILTNFLKGAADKMRIYNYAVSPDEIAAEYAALNELGYRPCANHNFVGSELNYDNSGHSYCRIDLADIAAFAQSWLTNGLY
ncbi:MAG: immunoglobulin domain-containing protein [Phycisphaerae bacterium]|nr:immunoglobulin domain-containing protein [Phycisphaerae bacterium]